MISASVREYNVEAENFSCAALFFPLPGRRARNDSSRLRHESLATLSSVMNVNPDSLAALLAQRAADDSTALIERNNRISFRALAEASRRVARGLAALGVGPGQRVALWLPDVPAWLEAFFACAQLGAIAVSVNTRFRTHELADLLARSGASVLVFWPGFKHIDFGALLAECPREALEALRAVVLYDESGALAPATVAGKPARSYRELAAQPPLEQASGAPDAGCAIFTTSGTTKAPKFVLHDQRGVLAHAQEVVHGFGIGADAVVLLAPPLCGVFGFCTAMAAFAAGRPLVMAPAWDPARAARDIAQHRVTHANGTDEAVAQLLAQNDAPVAFPTLRLFGYAAFNPALEDIVERAEARGLTLVGLYGASEIQALFARQDGNAPAAERALAGGRPVSGAARVRVREPGSGRILPHGEAGELEFFAPSSRMAAYYGDPQATREALTADGYYRSGDLGCTTPDGRFVFLARMGDALRLGGFLVSPAEIEAVVQELPGIAACQVVAARRPSGPVPVAFVMLSDGAALDEAAVLAHAGTRLARYKVPARVFALREFPVTPGANATKIQKAKLREMAEALLN
jgi:fatty-acyl-CoA synthase